MAEEKPSEPMAAKEIPCRLCGAAARLEFSKRILSERMVSYFCCKDCGSLETEPPTWLDEAYSKGNLADLDVGAAFRNLDNLLALIIMRRVFGWGTHPSLLDYGGGDGLLVRLLRDEGFNAEVSDAYADRSAYAIGSKGQLDGTHQVVTAFEVLEHFPNPRQELAHLFEARPDFLIVTTELFSGQGTDWWYLAPETGQHVFFYSRRGLEGFAAQRGYRLATAGPYILMTRGPIPGLRLKLLKKLLKNARPRVLYPFLSRRKGAYVERDFEVLRARLDSGKASE